MVAVFGQVGGGGRSSLGVCGSYELRGIRIFLLTIGVLLACGGCGNGIVIPGVGVIGGQWRYHCGPAKTLGQYCETQEECLTGSFCDTQKKVCSNAWTAFGAKCVSADYGCKGFCMVDKMIGTCFEAKCDANGSCTTGAKLAKACDPDDPNPSCGSANMCVAQGDPTSTCIPLPKLGESCFGFGTCTLGLVCDPVEAKCVAATPVTGPCKVKETCEKGMFCIKTNGEVADQENPGFCSLHPNLPVGAACVGDVCAKGLHCNYSKNKCAKDYATGASCSQGNECGEYPGIPADCVQGKCVATTKAGASCYPYSATSAPESRCSGGLFCTSEP